jgi:hypothetical protein
VPPADLGQVLFRRAQTGSISAQPWQSDLLDRYEPRPILGDARARRRVGSPELHEQLALRGGVVVAFSVEHEVGSREGAVGPGGRIEHRDVRFDLTLLNRPC